MPLLAWILLGGLAAALLWKEEGTAIGRAIDKAGGIVMQYVPGSPNAIALFTQAAHQAGFDPAWGADPALQMLLSKESQGKVGIPNYTYGDREKDPARWPEIWNEIKNGIHTTTSTATGLGQLLVANVKQFYPSGVNGIGDPVEEAIGMLRYLNAVYGPYARAHGLTPAGAAWQFYGKPKPVEWGMPPTAEGY